MTATVRTAASRARATDATRPRIGAFRADIEGLRAVAVLLVVLSHAGVGAVAGGYVGVDVFFVISGFLITSLLLREVATTGRISMSRFYARRALRLLPAAALVCVATLVGARLWLSGLRTGEFAKDALSATAYVANVRFAITGTDYLDADQTPSPFQHFWSLAVEEQFYLVWPLLIIAATLLWRRRRNATLRPLAAALLTLIAVSAVLSVTETQRSAPWAYFGAHTRAWELGVGALVAIGAGRLSALPGRLRAVLGWGGLAAIGAAAVAYGPDTAYPGGFAALPVAGAAAVIAAGVGGRAEHGAALVLERAPMRTVGRLSYGWYLWHWPVLMIGPAALGIGASTRNNLVLAAGAFLAAGLTYRLVENPLRHRPALRVRPVRGLLTGAALSAVVATVAVVVAVRPAAVPEGGRATDLRTALAESATPEAVLRQFIADSDRPRKLPSNLDPGLRESARDKPQVYADGCHLDSTAAPLPAGCVYGDPTSATTVVLFGDSHAAQWFPAMQRIAVDRGWRLVSLSKSACTAADLPIHHEALKREYTECAAFHRAAIDRIAALRPRLVVVGTSFNYDPIGGASWRAGWASTFGALRDTGARVVAFQDTPYMGGRVPACLEAHSRRIDRCDVSQRSALRGPEQRELFTEYARGSAVTVIDPVPWLCTDTCPAVVGNMLVYRDSNHMTTAYNRMLAPLLDARLPRL
ncbi:acyltransferase family protein [Mangrovihabitans endophyticus]|uniref:Acyltransferase n=1 Tax=Mangrovihabitans endophyticus TaxID=1751298 RepID=A0A8J3FP41_9ACTN|nr:acyltransferase family protein [Mangrovihabitans endophyticus]GGK89670.1 acyltransferase [Mangrovihabitans endophyticus]